MDSMNAQQIYDNFHTHAKGTAKLQAGHDNACEVADSFHKRADAVQQLMDTLREAWQGIAADQATTAMIPLAVNFHEAGDDLRKAQDLISRQAGSFHHAASKVHLMPPEPQLQDALKALAEYGTLDPYVHQVNRYQTAANNNVDAMNGYHGASTYNTSTLPAVRSDISSAPAGLDLAPKPAPSQPSTNDHSAPRSARPNTAPSRPSHGMTTRNSPGSFTAPSARRIPTVPSGGVVAAHGEFSRS